MRAKAIFRNPFLKDYLGPERRMAQLFWGLSDEKMPGSAKDLYELRQQNRSQDLWLQAMLAQDRVGQESFTVWCLSLIHI